MRMPEPMDQTQPPPPSPLAATCPQTLPLDLAYPIIFCTAALEARGPPPADPDNGSHDDFSDLCHEPNPDNLVSILLALPPTSLDIDYAASHRMLQRIILPHLPWLSPYRASQSCNLRVLAWWRDEAPNWSPFPWQSIQAAIERGHLPVVQWWWAFLSLPSHLHLRDRSFASALDLASQHNRIDILDFVGSHSPKPAYTSAAIDQAASVRVLDWWLERNVKDEWEPRYSPRAFVRASVAENPKEWLDWWMDRARAEGGWQFRMSDAILHTASAMGKLAALEWWKRRAGEAGLVIRLHDPSVNDEDPGRASTETLWYSHNVLDAASASAQLLVLDWWLHSGLTLAYSEAAITDAAWHGHDDVLEWWKKGIDEHGLELKFDSEVAISYASSAGHAHVLDWFLDESGWPFEYTHDAVDYAAAEGSIVTLDWWWSKRDRFEFRYSSAAIDRAFQHAHWHVVEWFKDHGLEPKCSSTALDMVIQRGELRILKMWESAGWPVKVGLTWERVVKLRGKLGDEQFGEVEEWWKRQRLPIDSVV